MVSGYSNYASALRALFAFASLVGIFLALGISSRKRTGQAATIGCLAHAPRIFRFTPVPLGAAHDRWSRANSIGVGILFGHLGLVFYFFLQLGLYRDSVFGS